MADKASNISRVMFSVRMYQLLLHAYPAKFQREYGSHMAQVFQDCCLRAVRQSGRRGLFTLWALTLLDFLRSVYEQHLQKETDMSKSMFIKLSGWAFTLGSFAFLTILSGSVAGAVVSSILIAIGMLGLRARYGESVGSLGRNSLLIGVVGMALVYASVPILRNNESWSLLRYSGLAILLTGFSLFGLVALVRKPLPHLNWLPFFAGIGFPVMYFPTLFFALVNNGELPDVVDNYWTIISIIASLQFLGLCILGIILQSDALEEVQSLA